MEAVEYPSSEALGMALINMSISGCFSQQEADYRSFLSVLWFADTGDNPVPEIIFLLQYMLP